MKKSIAIIAVIAVVLCVIGWFAVFTQSVSDASEYSTYVSEADQWVEEGLYQRAIKSYMLAIEQKPSQELYEKVNHAYKLRYQEAPEDTQDDYMDYLQSAVSIYPASEQLVDSFASVFYQQEKYEELYNCMVNAIANGYNTEQVQSMLLKARYAFKLKHSIFSGLKNSDGKYFTASRKNVWNMYDIEEGYLLTSDYDYVSVASTDGIFVISGEDSRIVNAEGMVLGIFEKKVAEAGCFAEGLIPACIDGVYSYYDEFAKKVFGEYEMAGMFQNGLAPVQKDGKWVLVNNKGEVKSETYDLIVLDYMGRYLIDDTILACKGGKFGFYDEKLKLSAELACKDVDIHTKDGIVAICQNDKWGYANRKGEVVIKPSYDQAKSFSNGLAAVCMNGKWGFVDTNGNLVIECQFTDAGYMCDNAICPVRTDIPEAPVTDDDIDKITEDTTAGDTTDNTVTEDTTADDTTADAVTEDTTTEDVAGDVENTVEEDPQVLETWKFLSIVVGIKEN